MRATLHDGARVHDITIYADGKTAQPVPIHLVPWLLTRPQCQYLQVLGLRLRRALNRALRAYSQDEAIRQVLPLTDDEQAWLAQLIPKGFPDPPTVFERLDTNLVIEDPQWPRVLRFLEFNSVGIGCLHFMPIANQLVAEHLMPTFQEVLKPATCRATTDPRVLLRQTLEAHAKAIGRHQCAVAFVERREPMAGGADEMAHLRQWFESQGMQAVVADPRELEVKSGELIYKDLTIDVIYRDYSLSEVVSIETHGGTVDAIKHAFRQNQVVSGLTGEFDHKSLMEFLSNPEYERYFTPSQRRTFQTCIPWTRLMRPRKTGTPDRQEADLPEFVRANRERLVLKPNRAYGGQDVVMGMDVSGSTWDQAVVAALEKPNTWVVQEMVPLPGVEFLDPERGNGVLTEFVTVGFVATPQGIAFLGRSSPERIVNISRGGSLVPVFLIR